jgi:arylsulfatase A-like enzyme/Tfp pilus assembly protein PilF
LQGPVIQDYPVSEKPRRRGLLFLILIGMAGIFFIPEMIPCSQAGRGDVNLLLITIDTIRPDRLSCYSPKYVKTPHIDALASRGILFERAFAHNPTTLPSHTNILLGATPLYHGVHDNSKFKVAGGFLTLAEHLKAAGYATGAFIGAFPLDSRFGLSQGFDVYDEKYSSGNAFAFTPPERKAGEVVETAIDWLSSQRSKWFSWIHIWDPHTMYDPPEPFLTDFKEDPYSGEVAYVDSELGKLFDYLERRDLLENTVIVLTGDHGEALGEHGELTHSYFAYNSTLWVPLIIAAPGFGPRRIQEYVSHVDIFPTVCDILHLDKPPSLQGVSLVSCMEGNKLPRRAIYIESMDPYYNSGAAPLRGFIEEEKKFLDSPLPEFYDLTSDFDEKANLIQNVELGEKQKELAELMKGLSSEQGNRSPSKVDREALEKLRSLGYVSSAVPKLKESYGPQDDLKTLMPYQRKLDDAISLFDEGKFDESIRLLEELLREKKDMTRAYIYLNHIYKSRGQAEKSRELLAEGSRSNPDNYEVVSAYGIALIETGRLDEGIDVFQKALSLVDFDPMAWNYLGFAYWQKGDEEKAFEYYNHSLALDADFAMTNAFLGILHLTRFSRTKIRADYARSMEYLKKAIGNDPGLAIAYKWLGTGYKVGGRPDAAIAVWKKALELNPSDAFVVVNLGRALLEKGSKDEALGYFERYIRLRGDTLSPEERREVESLIQKCKQR